jgi:hypothetical protein
MKNMVVCVIEKSLKKRRTKVKTVNPAIRSKPARFKPVARHAGKIFAVNQHQSRNFLQQQRRGLRVYRTHRH